MQADLSTAQAKGLSLEVASKNISINSLATCGFDIKGDVFLRYIERNKIDPDKMKQLFPTKRFGKPEELIAAVLFLCSDDARFIVGETLIMDGGFTVQ
jgi:NAD(P)-dependent dehydrogenase (short-subunit alcohol dehydrogenase family)